MQRLGRVVVLAITLSLTGTLVACSDAPRAAAASHDAIAPADVANGEAAAMLKQNMRKLWTDHVVWTRMYIMEAVGDQPDAAAAAARLMKNQEDTGNAIAAYYGADAGKQLTTLLKEHISIAVDIIKAAKAGDNAGQKAADTRWRQNADQIATFLSKANPHLPKDDVKGLLLAHGGHHIQQIQQLKDRQYDAEAKTWDEMKKHVYQIADATADALAKQFVKKFA